MLRLASTFALVPMAALALAGPQGYASRQQQIRAGVVVLESDLTNGVTRSSAPHAFWNLERSNLKPPGWTFVNPFGPTTLAGDAFTRWTKIQAALGGTGVILNQTLSKSDGPYWEVNLSNLSEDQISQYDILLISPRTKIELNTREREALRRFMDKGGILWTDMGAVNPGRVDPVNNIPLSFGLVTGNQTTPSRGDLTQALLSRPNTFGYFDFGLLNAAVGNAYDITAAVSSTAPLVGVADDFLNFQNVLSQGSRPTVALARVGDGFEVVTSRGLSIKLNATVATGTSADSNGLLRGDGAGLTQAGAVAGRFLVNLVSLSTEFRQQGGGSRRAGSVAIDIPAPLMRRFAAVSADASQSNGETTPPIIYKNVAYVVTNNRLVAYDTDPSQDLDGDGNADDGVPDYGSSFGADKIWESKNMPGPISAPVAVESVRAGGTAGDQIIVVDKNGTIHAFSALNDDATGHISQGTGRLDAIYTLDPPAGASTNSGEPPNAPTVYGGLIIVADNQGTKGRIWMARARTGSYVRSNRAFRIGGTGSEVTLAPITSGATVGSIPIADNSGGTDLVAYVPTRSNGAGSNASAGISSIWIGAQGERPVSWTQATATGGIEVTTRASQQGGLPIWCPSPTSNYGQWAPRIMLVYKNTGDPVSDSNLSGFINGTAVDEGGGVIRFGTRQIIDMNKFEVRVDYRIDWGQSDGLQGVVRGGVNFPDTDNSQRVLGNIAMSGRGTIFATVGPTSPSIFGGSLYALREEGRGTFRLLTRYDLYSEHKELVNGAQQTIRETLADNDPVNIFIPGGGEPELRRLKGLRFTSSPVVRGDQVFAAASATKQVRVGASVFPFASTVVMAFKAEPLGVEIPVQNLAIPDGTSIVQKDLARSQDKTLPDQESQFQAGQYTFDAARGIIRIDNLMTSQKGPIQGSLSTSLPIILRKPDGGDTLIEPNRLGGRFSPLLWYTVFSGFNTASSSGRYRPAGLFVAGNTLYTAGDSFVPSILTDGTLNSQGLLNAIDAEVPTGDAALLPDGVRPWQNQLVQFTGSTPANFRASEHFRWPLLKGVTSGDDYLIRLNQTTLGRGFETTFGVVGGAGTIFGWSQKGVAAFRRSDLVVADSGRIGVFDAGGSPIYTTDASVSSGPRAEGSVGTLHPLVRPSRAYALGGQELLVADPGANRVARIASDGTELRSIDRFVLDKNIVPRGFGSGDPQTLSGPRDIAMWSGYVNRGAQDVVTSQGNTEYWVHYLVADSGNRRLVELIDRYRVNTSTGAVLDPVVLNGEPQIAVLFWHSPEALSGADYEYSSIQRVFIPGSGNTGRYVYIAGLGGLSTPAATVGLDGGSNDAPVRGGNGGVIIFDPANPKGSSTIDRISVPGYAGAEMWNPATGMWQSAVALNDLALQARRGTAGTAVRPLGAVNSVTARVVDYGTLDAPSPILTIMVATNDGVYEFTPQSINSSVGNVQWYLPVEAYKSLRHTKTGNNAPDAATNVGGFRPTFARRLESGEVLVVNAYQGRRGDGSDVFGEVIQLSGDEFSPTVRNLGFNLGSLRYELPPIQGTRGLIQPLFADRR
ncbi:hypothetical protein BH11ARM2_BH11ARM2_10120 [soil metagenome]